MGKKNLFLPILKCDTCSLTTKNHYIMKRHRPRCRRKVLGPDSGEVTDESFEPASGNISGSIVLIEPRHEKSCLVPYVNNNVADQPAHPRSLIRAVIVRCLDSIIV